jgi:UDP-2,3-diacylglucosamine pyrophosphatase LpxH
MIPVPSFEQLSVISDLHIGGEEGFQIFTQGPLLAAYLDDLRQNSPKKSGLVINGDTVDFLAEPAAKAFDPLTATTKLDRIAADKPFKPVWDALRKYVKARHLVITLGNHDLELALPWVKQHFLDLLTDGDDSARSHITLSFDGAGFACTVGHSNVLCLHGNEVDTWNVTDYEALRRIGSDITQGRTAADWTPNAGSKLVIDVMNDIKREFAFVDLLKPEKEGAVRLLLVLKPDQRPKLRSVSEIAARRMWDGIRRRVGWLSVEEDEEDTIGTGDPLARLVGRMESRVDAVKLLDRAETLFRDTNPVDLVYGQQVQQLGWWDALAAAITRREPHEIAFEAIKDMPSTSTFNVGQTDADFERIDELAGADYDVVIAGHTHLARALDRSKGRGRYFNSGTWANLMQLTPVQLQSPAAFKPVFDRLRDARTIAGLGKLVAPRPTVVTVPRQGQPVLEQLAFKGRQIVSTALKPSKS